jgi:putative SOS response-associated peptidase YedK
MCGRFTISKKPEDIASRYQVKLPSGLKPRYNVAPMQNVGVITARQPDSLQSFRWGLVPSWSLDASTSGNLINAKAETIFSKIPFKHCIREQRCLVPADGFYEWKKAGKERIPYRFTLSDGELFSFAGLHDAWENPETGEQWHTFTIITTEANKLVRNIHDRMPVILRKDLERLWIAPDLSDAQVNSLLKPYDAGAMTMYETHRMVNSVANDGPECIQAAPKYYPGETLGLFDAF